MELPQLTDTQRRALFWLPGDGEWNDRPGSKSQMLERLWWHHRDLVEREFGRWGIKGGSLRWRLTAKGLAVRQELERMAPAADAKENA